LPELNFDRVDLYEMPLHSSEMNIARNALDNPNWQAEQDALLKKRQN
jgi:hypothetical protein